MHESNSQKSSLLYRYETIIIHGMGASILKAVKLSLKVEEVYANCKTEIETSSEPTIIDIKNKVLLYHKN